MAIFYNTNVNFYDAIMPFKYSWNEIQENNKYFYYFKYKLLDNIMNNVELLTHRRNGLFPLFLSLLLRDIKSNES